MGQDLHDEAAIQREIEAARLNAMRENFVPPQRNLAHLLSAQTKIRAKEEFLIWCDDDRGRQRRWTWMEVREAVERAAGFLAAKGVGVGDRVAFLAGNLDHTIILYFAAWSLGACVAPINAAEKPERKRFILDNSNARVLFCRTEFLDEGRELSAHANIPLVAICEDDDDQPSDLDVYPGCASNATPTNLDEADFHAQGTEALLIYTSGTTGPPKGVMVDQYNIMADAAGMALWHGWQSDLTMMCVLPIHHVNGIVVTHATPLFVGGRVVLNGRFNSRTFWERVATEGVNVVSVVPTLLEFLVDADKRGLAEKSFAELDTSSMETVICGAGPLLVETALAFEDAFGIRLTHGYGLSETTCYNCHMPPDIDEEERRGWYREHGFPSIGIPLPHQEMAIIGPDGSPRAAGERGEICVRGSCVSLGYHQRPDANAGAFKHGWFHSGDEGFFLEDRRGRAFFFITGRMKELIIRGGVNYSPLEIDEVLNAHPDVQHGLAVPFANRYYGDEIAAYVVPREGASPDPDAIIAFCRERLDFGKTPKVVVFGTEVPYTTTGKPRRLELVRQLADDLSAYRDKQFRKP